MRRILRTMIPSTAVVWFFLTGVTGIPASVWLAAMGTAAGAAQGAPGAASYTEDFSVADRFRRDCAAESGLKVFPKLGLSSAGPQGGDVMYDLQKILPGWTKDSIVVLTYEGGGGDVGNQMIGVHCDSGPSTDQLAEFSKAAYGKPVVVRGRYRDRLFQHSFHAWDLDVVFAACLGLREEVDQWHDKHFARTFVLPCGLARETAQNNPAAPSLPECPSMQGMGTGVIPVLEMLLQDYPDELIVLPCWPENVPVDFTLYSPYARGRPDGF